MSTPRSAPGCPASPGAVSCAVVQESEFFFRLTPDRVLEAVESGGFSPSGHCFALNALENRVYDVRLEGVDQC